MLKGIRSSLEALIVYLSKRGIKLYPHLENTSLATLISMDERKEQCGYHI